MVLIGKCCFPLYSSKSEAEDRFLLWRVLNGQRMGRNGWSFVGCEGVQTSLRPSMASFRRSAERNRAKVRLRSSRARRMASGDFDGEVWREGPALDEPLADDRLPPDRSDFQLTLLSASSLPLASTDPRLTFSPLKRSGDTLESESAKERKKEEGDPGDAGHLGVPRDPKKLVNLATTEVARRMRMQFVRRSFPKIFRARLIYPQRDGRHTKLFTGAILRFPYSTNNLKFLAWKEWAPQQPRTVELVEILPPGPSKGRVLNGLTRQNGSL